MRNIGHTLIICLETEDNGGPMRVTNCKLSYAIIDKLMQPDVTAKDRFGQEYAARNVTATEFDLLFYLSVRQDPWGRVQGVYYKDVAKELCFASKQTFYNALYGLRDKKYINIFPVSLYEDTWDIVINDNMYIDEKDDRKGYFNTNRAYLHTPEFYKLKVNEKKLCILLTKKYQTNNFMKYGLDICPDTIASWLGIKSTSLVFEYMENIKIFFPHKRVTKGKGEIFHLYKDNSIPSDNKLISENERFYNHKIIAFCRNHNIDYTVETLKDLIILIAQYASISIGRLFGTICDVLLNKRSIEPKLIHWKLINPSY